MAEPASSPVLVMKLDVFNMMGLPSTLTLALPSPVSDDRATFGYGIGIGPAGDGVLHTSGKVMRTPPLDLWTTVSLFTITVAGIAIHLLARERPSPPCARRRPTIRTPA